MEIITTTLDKKSDGKIVTIKRQVEEKLTKTDVLQRKSQLQFQAEDIKRQLQLVKQRHDETMAAIAECDELLQTFDDEVLEGV